MTQDFVGIHLYHAIGAHKQTWHKTSIETFYSFFMVHFTCNHPKNAARLRPSQRFLRRLRTLLQRLVFLKQCHPGFNGP